MVRAAALVFAALCCAPAPAAVAQPVQQFQPFPLLFPGFQGTPEEQAACKPDVNRFCQEAVPDTFRVLACLQQARQRIGNPCRRVLESHGQ